MPQGKIIGIGLETDFLSGAMTGVGNYCFQLLKALMEDNQDVRFSSFSGLSWHPFGRSDLERIDRAHGKSGLAALPADTTAPSTRTLKQAIRAAAARNELARRVYRAIRRQRLQTQGVPLTVDLFHAFKYLPLMELDIPVLPVVYDLSFVRFPDAHPQERLKELERLPDVVARAPFVHTISEFSKAEIMEVYGYPSERIIVAPPAASSMFRPLGSEITRAEIAPFDLSAGKYFLTVGTLEPRKNLRTLIAAYAELPLQTRSQNPLVIVGNSGWGKLELPPAADRMLSDGSLRFPGPVSDSVLRGLYEGARALLFPSIYEGFGMPVVEALACGTEAVHSSGTSMDEITGGAALTVPALDADAWTTAMKNLLDDGAQSNTGRESRIAQSKKFDWHRSAGMLSEVYRRIRAQ